MIPMCTDAREFVCGKGENAEKVAQSLIAIDWCWYTLREQGFEIWWYKSMMQTPGSEMTGGNEGS